METKKIAMTSPTKRLKQAMKTSLSNTRRNQEKNKRSNKKSTTRKPKIEYTTASSDMATNLPTTHTSPHYTFRRALSTATERGKQAKGQPKIVTAGRQRNVERWWTTNKKQNFGNKTTLVTVSPLSIIGKPCRKRIPPEDAKGFLGLPEPQL